MQAFYLVGNEGGSIRENFGERANTPDFDNDIKGENHV